MNVSTWSIRNPIAAILFFVILSFAGLVSFRLMKIQQFPDIDLPTITISASLPGASPSQLENDVARKLENSIANLQDVKHITTRILDGVVNINTAFRLEKNTQSALDDVRSAVQRVRADLPQDLRDPIVSKLEFTGAPILAYSVRSSELDEQDLSWLVDDLITKRLLSVKGLGAVTRVGGVNREVRIELNPIALQAHGLTAAEVSRQLKITQIENAGGRANLADQEQSIRTIATTGTAESLKQFELSLPGGRRLALQQIAEVIDTVAEPRSAALLDGQRVVGFEITRSRGASEVEVGAGVQRVLTQLQNERPDLTIDQVFNFVEPVQSDFNASMTMLFEGAILAVVVVLLFLRDFRATFISAVALPLSVIPTFAGMYLLGFSLNVVSLLAMSLVVGILVDDAIVEVENIVRHLRMGKTPLQAAIEAADEIGLAVIATTFTLIAVFLPTAFMSGIAGKFFIQFGWTASLAVFASLLVARMLTPMMCAYLLKATVFKNTSAQTNNTNPFNQTQKHDEHKNYRLEKNYGLEYNNLDNQSPKNNEQLLTQKLPSHELKPSIAMRWYLNAMNWALHHRLLTCVGSGAFFIGSIALIPLLPTGFIPADDLSQTQVYMELQPGSQLNETINTAEQARLLLKNIAHVERIYTTIGAGAAGTDPMAPAAGNDIRKATLTILLSPRQSRSIRKQIIEQNIRQALQTIPGVRYKVGLGGSGEKYILVLSGDNGQALTEAAREVERDLRTLPGIGSVNSSAALVRPEIWVEPNIALAAELGITTQAISDTLRVATMGDFDVNLAKLNLSERQIPIVVRLPYASQSDLDLLERLTVPSQKPNVKPVPLAVVANLEMRSGPAMIDRYDRARNVNLEIELSEAELGDVKAAVTKLPSIQQLPPGVVQRDVGDAEVMGELFASFGLAMSAGVLCVFVVLILLFKDILQPITILAALPLSIGGAFVALLLAKQSFSMPSLIGLIMLMGVATKNSILLVEYAVVAQYKKGMPQLQAVQDACIKRATPIIMTTIAMAAGMLPIAVGWGSADTSFRSPMAVAVIGGLVTSTFLSLLVIPVIYTLMDDLQKWIKRFY